MIKKISWGILCIAAFVWCIKIVNLNRDERGSYQYGMNEEIAGENISVKAVDALYVTQSGFLDHFEIEENIFEQYSTPDGKLICICLEVTNISDKKIEWDQVMEWTYCGFETRTWASTNMSYVEQKMNLFQTDALYPGQTQDIWYATLVNPVCFREETWEELQTDDFRYVLSLAPQKLSIQME